MKITITRSKEWVEIQRLDTGDNVPRSIEVEYEPAGVSWPARKVLLAAGCGQYCDLRQLTYNDQYELVAYSGIPYGCAYFLIDADEVSLGQVGAAIIAARDSILASKAEAEARHEAKVAEDAAKEKAIAEKDAKCAEARIVLSEFIGDLEDKLESSQDDCLALAKLLEAIPADAKRGALRKLVCEDTDEAVEELRETLESAAPSPVYILRDLDED